MKEQNRVASTLLALVIASHTLIGMAAGIPEKLPDPDQKPSDTKKPVKVYFMSGQSNMCGEGRPGTLKPLATGDEKFAYLVDDAGNWTVRNDVHYIYYCMDKRYNDGPLIVDRRFGPELGIGHVLGYYHDEVVLLIKGACGNRSLGFDFLPPSSRKRLGTPEPKPGAGWYAGISYDRYVKSAKGVLADLKGNLPGYNGQGYEMAGFFWWQGHKDKGMAKEKYEQLLAELIKDFRKDFDAPKDTPFVLATVGFNGRNLGPWEGVFNAQMAVSDPKQHPEFKGNVGSVDICDMGGGGTHYANNGATYAKVGDAMGRAMAELQEEVRRKSGARSGSGHTSASATRSARKLHPGKGEDLKRILLNSFEKMSTSGLLKPTRVPLSLTRADVSLVSVQVDHTLTFRSASGKSVPIDPKDLKLIDFTNLAVLLAKLKPDSTDARALAGAYLECLGRVALADKYFAKAGPESTAIMDVFFE